METEAPEQVQPDASARITEIFQAFEAKAAAGATASATYLFDLHGDGGGTHLLRISPTGVSWEKDYSGEADVRIKLSVLDFLAIADGTFDGRLAVASERIELEGDLALAESLLGQIEPDEG